MKKIEKICSLVCLPLLLALVLIAGALGVADFYIPDTLSRFDGEEAAVGAFYTLSPEGDAVADAHVTTESATARLFGLFPIKRVKVRTFENLSLCPGGNVFGITIQLGGAMVTALSEITDGEGRTYSPAKEAGLLRGDLITAVDGEPVSAAGELSRTVAASEGRTLVLTVKRGKESLTLSLTPRYSAVSGGYRAGVFVKDRASGIGTVTFIDPATGAFGGLGHGVYDNETAMLLPIRRGAVTSVTLSGVVPGTPGDPGELRGHLGTEKTGTLLSNTDCGVFGVLTEEHSKEEAIPIGLASSVHVGPASIYCTFEDGVRGEYAIEITELRSERSATKSFCIRVTDERLLARTGGIVQGMSGSPIIQDGRLIGAVTHVMIGDPAAGYGIFIENMLAAAEGERKAA